MNNNAGSATSVGPSEFWLLTADRRRARLLSGSLTPHGRIHVDPLAEVQEEWDDLQHERPSPRAAKNGHTYASLGHEEDERIRRFAKEVSEWLESEMIERRIPKLHALCARRLLGHLRKVLPVRLHDRVVDHALDLAHLTPGQLAVHEAVVAIEKDARRTAQDGPPGRTKVVIAMTRDQDQADRIAREHAAIRDTIRNLRAEIDRLRSESGPGHEVGGLPSMLRELNHSLLRHFELEEQGGFLGSGSVVSAGTEREIERLVGQHGELQQKLAALLDGVERAAEGRASLSDYFVQGLRDFLAELLEHESAENQLVQKTVTRDVGVGD